MPTQDQVLTMSMKQVCNYLTRIRKSIFKGKNSTELETEINAHAARHYLKLLVVQHYANHEIRELELKLKNWEVQEFKLPVNTVVSNHADDKDDGSMEDVRYTDLIRPIEVVVELEEEK